MFPCFLQFNNKEYSQSGKKDTGKKLKSVEIVFSSRIYCYQIICFLILRYSVLSVYLILKKFTETEICENLYANTNIIIFMQILEATSICYHQNCILFVRKAYFINLKTLPEIVKIGLCNVKNRNQMLMLVLRNISSSSMIRRRRFYY